MLYLNAVPAFACVFTAPATATASDTTTTLAKMRFTA
jgi:hypothetical protein